MSSETPEVKKRFAAAVSVMFETFGDEPSRIRLKGYWMALSDIPIASIEQAICRHLTTNTKVATPAELRQLANGGRSGDRAVRAWSDVEPLVSRIGAYKHVDFADLLINATIRNLSGTWSGFCEKCHKDPITWVRKEFIDLYQTLARCRLSAGDCRPLAGLAEVAVVRGCVTAPVPMRIQCDPERRALPLPLVVEPKAIGESARRRPTPDGQDTRPGDCRGAEQGIGAILTAGFDQPAR